MKSEATGHRFVDSLPCFITRVTGSDRGLRGLWTPRWTPEFDASELFRKLAGSQEPMALKNSQYFDHAGRAAVNDPVVVHDEFP